MSEAFDAEAWTRGCLKTWSEVAEGYGALSARLFGPVSEEFVVFAGLRRGWRVLEAACGTGTATRAAAKRLGERGSILATDLSPRMIELAAAAPAPAGAPVEWRALDAEALDAPPSSFDAAFCQLGLMLFARPEAALASMARAVRPGGPVSVLVQGSASRMAFTSLIMRQAVRAAPQLKPPEGTPSLHAFGAPGALESCFAAAGLVEIVTRRLQGAFPFPSAEDYWDAMLRGAGRTGEALRTLPAPTLEKVRKEVLRQARRMRRGSGIAVPYEFVMARGHARPAAAPRPPR